LGFDLPIKAGAYDQNNNKENHAHILHKVGDQLLLEKPGRIPKLEAPCTGPYTITHIYTNGTI